MSDFFKFFCDKKKGCMMNGNKKNSTKIIKNNKQKWQC